MFCTHCGTKGSGNFCGNCGCRLTSPDAPPLEPAPEHEDLVVLDEGDWQDDCRYERILRVDAVRTVIARHAASAPKGLSGEAVLEIYDKLVASPVPLASLATVLQPLYDSWGIRMTKERIEAVAAPVGRVIARVLCSLARHGQKIEKVEQFDAGCLLIAELPSSVCALAGQLTVGIERRPKRTKVTAATRIPGQMYDWGKSQRCLDVLFKDLDTDLGLPGARALPVELLAAQPLTIRDFRVA